MLLYVWSREFPNAQINIYGLVALKVCPNLVQCILVFIHRLYELYEMKHIVHRLIGTIMLNSFSGILSSMGDACFGCHFWFTSYAKSVRYHCRTSILLFDSVASTSRWKEHFEDSIVGVSLSSVA